jgi:pyruvate formate lyase activating enzyme
MTAAAAARLFEVQRFCVHDGPGIRTTVFLEGCPLRCAWCQNPEAFFGGCAAPREVSAVVDEVERDAAFYRTSGGGLTLSGGEPLLRPATARALLEEARRRGLHTCVQTCGAVPEEHFAAVLGLVDLFQFDLKHLDPARHRVLTGVDPAQLHRNAAFLVARGAAVQFRMPVVPGVNDDRDNVEATGRFVRALGAQALRLVPYQRLYLGKWQALGRAAPLPQVPECSVGDLARVQTWLAALGVTTEVDG